MVVDTGNSFWKLENGIWRVSNSFTRENNYQFEMPRKKDKNGKIIQYSTEDWFKQGKNPGGAAWNPGGGDGFGGNKAKAWTKGIVGMLTGNEKIMDAALHGSTDDFLKSTGEGMSDAELAINLAVIGGGIVGGIASSRAGVRSGHAEAGNLKAMRAKYKISKAQVFEEAKKQGRDISKVDEAKVNSFVEEWNKRDPVDNLKIADTYFSKEYADLNTKQRAQQAQKPVWKGGSWDRASAADKSSFTIRWNAWKAGQKAIQDKIDRVGAKFSQVRSAYNRLKAARDRRLAEEQKAKAEKNVKKFETDNNLKPLTFMEYLQEFKKVYKKNPTETELANFKITFNKFRVDLNNVDAAVRETALENYKSAGQPDPTSTYFRMWEDIKSKNNGKIDLKAFEEQIKTESLEAFKSARASRIKAFEEQHGLKKMTIEEYIYKYQQNHNGYRPNRAQLKKFIADYNDYRVDLNSISESTKAKIMEDYEAAGEKTPNLFEVWEVNKAKGGDVKAFEQELLKDAAQSRRAAEYTEKITKLEGLDKNKDGQLTKEEVKAFNKKFDFDADGILGKEERAAKAKEIEEKYPDLDAEERRLLEDDEVEVDLFGEEPARTGEKPKTDSTGRATKAAAGGMAAGAVAGAVAAAVSGGSDKGGKDGENWRDWELPDARRRMIEVNVFERLLEIFRNPYYYPTQQKNDPLNPFNLFKSDPTMIENTNPPFMPNRANYYDFGGNEVPVNMEEKAYHPDITKKKVHELLLKTEGAYSDEVEPNAVFINKQNGVIDIQVKVYTEPGYKVVAFRGSDHGADWIQNLNAAATRLDEFFPFIKNSDNLIGHDGFIRSVSLVYDDIKKELDGVANFEITGHSYAAAMATIFAYVYHLDTFKLPLHAFVFGSPRVFIGDVEKYNKKIDLVRFQNSNDAATYVPSNSVSPFGAIGAMAGGFLASRLQPRIGAMSGAIVGGAMAGQLNPLPYKHVGLGITLFKEKNEVVDLGSSMLGNEGERVVPETYLFIPEGQDILRNPVDLQGVVMKEAIRTLLGEGLRQYTLSPADSTDVNYQTLFSSYVDDAAYGLPFLNKAFGYFQLFLDSNRILISNKYEKTLLKRLQRFRREELTKASKKPTLQGEILRMNLEAGLPIPYGTLSVELYQKFQLKIFRASQEFYQIQGIDRARYTNEGLWVQKFWAEKHSMDEPEYLEYLDFVQETMDKFFKEQESRDFFVLRDAFMRFIVADTILWTGHITQALSLYNQLVGHKISTYLTRTDLLPDIIYSGQNIPEIISDTSIGGGGGGFDTYYRRNPHMPHRNYYDKNGNGFYLDNFNKIQPVNKILGFVFYKDPSVLNQLILY